MKLIRQTHCMLAGRSRASRDRAESLAILGSFMELYLDKPDTESHLENKEYQFLKLNC